MELFLLAASASIITLIGVSAFLLITVKGSQFNFSEKLAIGYGIGTGLITIEMLLISFLNIKFDIVTMLIPWLPIIIAGLFIFFRQTELPGPRLPAVKEEGVLRLFKTFLISALSFEVAYTFFRALVKPIESYDAIAIYAIKSKIFYLAKSVPQDFFQNIAFMFPHPDYPLNIPLAETFAYILMGNINDQLVKLIFPLYYSAILVLFYFGLRRFASQLYSLLFTFILASVAQFNAFATNGYLDVPLAYYYFASALFLFMWFEDIKRSYLLTLSAVMAGLAAWTKNEGLMYCAINSFLIFLFFILKNKKAKMRMFLHLLLYCAVIAVINIPWILAKNKAHFVNTDIGSINLSPSNIIKQMHNIGIILYGYQREFFGPKKWNMFWPVVFIVFILYYRKALSGSGKYITTSLILAIAGYTFFYLFSSVEVSYFVNKTWSRFLIHFLPVAVYWLAYMLKDDIKI